MKLETLSLIMMTIAMVHEVWFDHDHAVFCILLAIFLMLTSYKEDAQ